MRSRTFVASSLGFVWGAVACFVPTPRPPANDLLDVNEDVVRLPLRRRPGPDLSLDLSRMRLAEESSWFATAAHVALSEDPAASDALVVQLVGARAREITPALVLLGGAAARETLGVALDHDDDAVAVEAARALGVLGDPQASAALGMLLADGRLRTGCGDVLAAAVALGRASPSGADRAGILEAAAASPTLCGIATRELALAAMGMGDLSASDSLLSTDVLADGPLSDAVRTELAGAGPQTIARAREAVDRSADPDLVAVALEVIGVRRDVVGLDLAARRLEQADLAACVTPNIAWASRQCRLVAALTIGLARVRDARARPAARALWSGRACADTTFAGLVALAWFGEPSIATPLLEVFRYGGDWAERLLAMSPTPPFVSSVLANLEHPTGPECRALFSVDTRESLVVAGQTLADARTQVACSEAAASRLWRGRTQDRIAVLDAIAPRVTRLAARSGPTSGEESAEASWVLRTLAGVPLEQQPLWSTSRAIYLRLAAGSPDEARRPAVLAAMIALRTRSAPSPDARLLDAVRALSAQPIASGAAITRLAPPGPKGVALLEAIAPGSAASPAAGVPDADHSVATARLIAGSLVAGRNDFVSRRRSHLDPRAADLLAEMAAREGGLPMGPLVPWLVETRAPGLPAALAMGCDERCIDPLAELLHGPDAWGRTAAAAVAGAAGLAVPGLSRVAPSDAQARNETRRDAALFSDLIGFTRSPRVTTRWTKARAWIAVASAGRDPGPPVDTTQVDCVRPGEDPLGAWLTAAYAVRALPRTATSTARVGPLAWGLECLTVGTGLAPSARAVLEGATPPAIAALFPPAIEAARRRPRDAWLERLATSHEAGERARTARMIGERVPARERQRFGEVLFDLAGDDAPEVRQAAARSMPMDGPRAEAIARRLVFDASPAIRRAALANSAIVASLDLESIAALAVDDDPEVRGALARGLRAQDLPFGRPALRRLVADTAQRPAAVAEFCRGASVNDLAVLLQTALDLSRSDRDPVLEACASGREAAGASLAPLLAAVDDRDLARSAAAVGLAAVLGPTDRLRLLERASIRRRAVRAEAAVRVARAVLDEADAPGGAALARRLVGDPEPTVRCATLAGAEAEPERSALAAALAHADGTRPDLDAIGRSWGCP